MAVKGTIAKNNVAKKLAAAFGSDYIGEHDKKYYIWADDGGERVQIAVTMTYCKNPISTDAATPVTKASNAGFNWDEDDETTTSKNVEITAEEKQNIENLMAKFGL